MWGKREEKFSTKDKRLQKIKINCGIISKLRHTVQKEIKVILQKGSNYHFH